MDIEKFVEAYTAKTTFLGISYEVLGFSLSVLIVVVGFFYVFGLRNNGNFARDAINPVLITMFLTYVPITGVMFIDINARDFVRDHIQNIEGSTTAIELLSQFEENNHYDSGFLISANVDGKRKVIKVSGEDVKLKKDLATGEKPYMKYVDIKVDYKKYNDYKWLNGTHVQEIHVSKDFKINKMVSSAIQIK